jgi:rare lipoprotein A
LRIHPFGPAIAQTVDDMMAKQTSQNSGRTGAPVVLLFLFLLLLATGCATSRPTVSRPTDAAAGFQVGIASFYADKYHGKPTASGELYNKNGLTAAHRSYPFGTRVRITNLQNERSVVVRVNDRGPFVSGRVIDVSLAAARELEMTRNGLARVQIDALSRREW